jgi:acyl-CoA reductase-like NAD-dependent aldehyde dehydrogenase
MIRHDSLFVGGRWVDPSSDRTIPVTSATTEERIGSVPEARAADVDAAVRAARHAADDPEGWSAWEPARRAAAIETLAAELERRGPQTADLVSRQNGMPIAVSGRVEAAMPAMLLRYYAGLARESEVEEERAHLLGGLARGTTVVRREPVGVVAAIAPWNFPQLLAAYKHAPALAAGCTVVLKPSPGTVLDAMVFAEAVAASDLPPGVVNVVPGGPETGATLVAHPLVDKVAFTGSTATGRVIAEACGRLLRPVTLELGGKSAAVVLEDADLDLATAGEHLFAAMFMNNGQTCYLSTRVLAPRSRYDEVVDVLAGFASSLAVGDPLDPATQIGPLASARHRDRVEDYVRSGLLEGARLVTGGGRPDHLPRGWFMEPTVLADVDNTSTVARHEIFGPVLAVMPYDDEDHAVRLANESDYGLGGTVWTSDPEHGLEVARRIRTGSVGVNGFLLDPGAPFGGVKASGLGRELGPEAIGTYQYTKAIYT